MKSLCYKARRRSGAGWAVAESIIALGVLGLLVTCLTAAVVRTRNFNRIMIARRSCISAAQAQLDNVAVIGAPIDASRSEELWPDLAVRVESAAGEGDWSGLTLVTATASTTVAGRDVSVSLRRYVLRKDGA